MHSELRFGILPSTGARQLGEPPDARHLVDLAVEAERLGFDSVWANDSLRSPRIEPLTLLAAIAAVTSRITLGTAALIPAYRQPVQAARVVASLDLLSGGRLVLGVGAGFPGVSDPDFALVGLPTGGRTERLDDTVALWRELWSAPGPARFDGAVLHVDALPEYLPTHRPGGPPVWLAAGAPAALGRAGARYDGWMPYPPAPGAYAAGLAQVRAAAEAQGRDPDAITRALFVSIAVTDDIFTGRQVLDDYCLAAYAAPLDLVETIQAVIGGPPDHVQEALGRYLDAGARHVIIRLVALDPASQRDQLHRVAHIVASARNLGQLHSSASPHREPKRTESHA